MCTCSCFESIISYASSVLKDMVRDLEQMKENEEKQVKTTTEKNGHFCCSEHSDFLENHSKQMCHRSDGGCTCYYCTIFGHTVSFSFHKHFLHSKTSVHPILFKGM